MNLDHLIFIVQENRSFDHYFGTFPGADGIPMKAGRPASASPTRRASVAPVPRHELVQRRRPAQSTDSRSR